MAPEVDREKKDAVDAKDFLEMLEKTYAEAGGKLREGRSQLERAQRDMARAGQQRQMAEQQADAARRAAGLSTTTSSLNVALKVDAGHRGARSCQCRGGQHEGEAADSRRSRNRRMRTSRGQCDTRSGKPAAPTNLTDRLAALRAARSALLRRHVQPAPA